MIIKGAEKSIAEARQEEIDLAREENRLIGDYALSSCSTDGAWSKKPSAKMGGHSSLVGYGSMISTRTKKVLSFGVKTLYCKTCNKYSGNDECPEHECNKNFNGPPGSMEPAIAVENLQDLYESANIIIHEYVGDGDAATEKAIQNSNLYRAQMITVKKWDCYLHLTRNFAGKIRILVEKYPHDKAALEGFHERILQSVRSIINKYHQELLNAAPEAKEAIIETLQNTILILPYHCLDIHNDCGSWCSRKNTSVIPKTIQADTMQAIRFLAAKLAGHSKSLIRKVTTNANECLNAVVNSLLGEKRRHYGNSQSCKFR